MMLCFSGSNLIPLSKLLPLTLSNLSIRGLFLYFWVGFYFFWGGGRRGDAKGTSPWLREWNGVWPRNF